MITILSNAVLEVSVHAKGAELNSIYNKETQQEYMWSGDPASWGKKSPVLFPVVGALKNNTFFYQGKSYQLSRHGFARDMVFEITEQAEDSVTFTLFTNEETLLKYPFPFRFDIVYTIIANVLFVQYKIYNGGNSEMLFSVGGHPAFKVPLAEETAYQDYFLSFSETENAGRWLISKDGLIENAQTPLLNNTNRLQLTKELFLQDALVFKHLRSDKVSLMSDVTDRGIIFNFSGFPFLGIWAAPQADFVCIEPWCGIADSVLTSQQLTDKEGINRLAPGEIFERKWSVTVF